eukprot:scaffold7944_cov145-Skeletonema_dohrnii-CCMP3373.AAC.1
MLRSKGGLSINDRTMYRKRGILKSRPRTGWVSQLASRQNMIGADSYAGVVSAARVTSKRC